MSKPKVVVKKPARVKKVAVLLLPTEEDLVRRYADQTGKTPLSHWFIDDHKTLCILWTDYSKDKFTIG